RGGEVVEVAKDRGEGGRQQAAAHVLHDVAVAVAEHGRREAVAAVALLELVLAEIADPRHEITSSPEGPTSAVGAAGRKVVERASRMIAGPCTRAPTGSRSRAYSPASIG